MRKNTFIVLVASILFVYNVVGQHNPKQLFGTVPFDSNFKEGLKDLVYHNNDGYSIERWIYRGDTVTIDDGFVGFEYMESANINGTKVKVLHWSNGSGVAPQSTVDTVFSSDTNKIKLTKMKYELSFKGFTNKTEAHNLKFRHLKWGNWIEYFKVKNRELVKTGEKRADIYRLTQYYYGKPNGIRREYYNSGKLFSETPYIDGKAIGVKKEYYESGELMVADTLLDKKGRGVLYIYYDSGRLWMEIPFINDCNGMSRINNTRGHLKHPDIPIYGIVNGTDKTYFENGKLQSETIWKNGDIVSSKHFDEKGNETK